MNPQLCSTGAPQSYPTGHWVSGTSHDPVDEHWIDPVGAYVGAPVIGPEHRIKIPQGSVLSDTEHVESTGHSTCVRLVQFEALAQTSP